LSLRISASVARPTMYAADCRGQGRAGQGRAGDNSERQIKV
jgi:hypothetical protein